MQAVTCFSLDIVSMYWFFCSITNLCSHYNNYFPLCALTYRGFYPHLLYPIIILSSHDLWSSWNVSPTPFCVIPHRAAMSDSSLSDCGRVSVSDLQDGSRSCLGEVRSNVSGKRTRTTNVPYLSRPPTRVVSNFLH